VKFDVAKSGDFDIHRFVPDEGLTEENSKRMFGENPEVLLRLPRRRPLNRDRRRRLGSAEGSPRGRAKSRRDASDGGVDEPLSRAADQGPSGRSGRREEAFPNGKKDKVRFVVQGGKR